MDFISIYFTLGLAMLLVVFWDYKRLPNTARRLGKAPKQNDSGFALIANEIRNMATMALFAFFLWPVVVAWEVLDKKDK
ncbi:MAG: hypothetical protein R8K20_03710 [Gallionellaceae bacterium]